MDNDYHGRSGCGWAFGGRVFPVSVSCVCFSRCWRNTYSVQYFECRSDGNWNERPCTCSRTWSWEWFEQVSVSVSVYCKFVFLCVPIDRKAFVSVFEYVSLLSSLLCLFCLFFSSQVHPVTTNMKRDGKKTMYHRKSRWPSTTCPFFASRWSFRHFSISVKKSVCNCSAKQKMMNTWHMQKNTWKHVLVHTRHTTYTTRTTHRLFSLLLSSLCLSFSVSVSVWCCMCWFGVCGTLTNPRV